ncbi:MAG: molybdate ABC transporter substrate-binding protein [Bacteroidales bacterium]|nr:molybdate ABC transporter substrate-binding protein [Bacteroidales bacterium]
MRKIILCLLIAFNISLQAQKVKIAAAADLRFAMDEVVKLYKSSNPQADIEVIYGSSGNAFTQISNGAPYDMYFSADILYPQKLKEAGLTATEPKLYAIGRIVLWSSTMDVSKGIAGLAATPKSKIAIANPDHAPYGKRAEESMKFYKIYDKVKPQLIYGENISQAAQFCLTGNADIGILALSIVLAPSMADKGKYVLIDEKSHQPLKQGFVVLKQAKDNKVAKAFAEYVSSKPARDILEKYGFALPN